MRLHKAELGRHQRQGSALGGFPAASASRASQRHFDRWKVNKARRRIDIQHPLRRPRNSICNSIHRLSTQSPIIYSLQDGLTTTFSSLTTTLLPHRTGSFISSCRRIYRRRKHIRTTIDTTQQPTTICPCYLNHRGIQIPTRSHRVANMLDLSTRGYR